MEILRNDRDSRFLSRASICKLLFAVFVVVLMYFNHGSMNYIGTESCSSFQNVNFLVCLSSPIPHPCLNLHVTIFTIFSLGAK